MHKLTVLAVALALASAAQAAPEGWSPQAPDPTLTPGKVDPAKTLAMVCVRGFTAQPGVRHVTEATKRAVFAEYGVDPTKGGPYEVDHLISLELGGSNDLANLWPQSYTSAPLNAHLKDALENRLHALVCHAKPSLNLTAAQHMIATDWPSAYRQLFPVK